MVAKASQKIASVTSMFQVIKIASVTGAQKAGTAGVGKTTCGWTKWNLNEQIIGHIMKNAKMFCLTLDQLEI